MTSGMAIVALWTLAAGQAAYVDVGPARIEWKIDKTQVSLIEFVSIRVLATAPEGASVERPVFQRDPENVSGVSSKLFGPDTIDGRTVWIWEMEVEPLTPGPLALPPLLVQVKQDGAVADGTLVLPAIEVTGDASLKGQSHELKEMPPAPAESSRFVSRVLRWAGILLFLLVGAYAILSRRRARSPSSADGALRELDDIERRAAPFRARVQDACDVLRRHLERQYNLPATRQTTYEFLSDDRTAQSLTPPDQSRLGEILPMADVERFGPEGPSANDWEQLLAMIRKFLLAESKA